MASSYKLMVWLTMLIMVFLPMVTKGDTLNPFYDELCSEVECGKGTCKAGAEYKFGYICECDASWKRTRLNASYEDELQYLPCVVPNCTLDYSCMPAPAPSPAPENPRNASVFDPCYWMYCGEGTCTKSTKYKFSCQCDSGYKNLLNNTAYPCYSDCALTSDCERLGITVSNSTSDSSNNDNSANAFIPGKFYLIGTLIISMALVQGRSD